MNKTGKEKRQEVIEEILSKHEIESQEELIKQLEDKGFVLTQATLSRDFREMKIAKTPDSSGKYFYRLPEAKLPQPKSTRYGMTSSFVRQGIINIECQHFRCLYCGAAILNKWAAAGKGNVLVIELKGVCEGKEGANRYGGHNVGDSDLPQRLPFACSVYLCRFQHVLRN